MARSAGSANICCYLHYHDGSLATVHWQTTTLIIHSEWIRLMPFRNLPYWRFTKIVGYRTTIWGQELEERSLLCMCFRCVWKSFPGVGTTKESMKLTLQGPPCGCPSRPTVILSVTSLGARPRSRHRARMFPHTAWGFCLVSRRYPLSCRYASRPRSQHTLAVSRFMHRFP